MRVEVHVRLPRLDARLDLPSERQGRATRSRENGVRGRSAHRRVIAVSDNRSGRDSPTRCPSTHAPDRGIAAQEAQPADGHRRAATTSGRQWPRAPVRGLPVCRRLHGQVQLARDDRESPIDRPQAEVTEQRAGDQVHVHPADSPPGQARAFDERQHLLVRND